MMLVIRDAQRAALQLDTDTRWYEGRLSQRYPLFAQAASAQRQQWVRDGVARAESLHLTRAEHLQFLCFEQTFFPGCLDRDDFAWARRLLVQPGVSPADRVKALRHATIQRLLQAEEAAELAVQAAAVDQAFPDPVDLPDEPEAAVFAAGTPGPASQPADAGTGSAA